MNYLTILPLIFFTLTAIVWFVRGDVTLGLAYILLSLNWFLVTISNWED